MTKRKVFRNRYCMCCGEVLPVSSQAKYCGKECAAKVRKEQPRSEADEVREAMRTVSLMRLYAELDRCSTHWERAKILSEIELYKR